MPFPFKKLDSVALPSLPEGGVNQGALINYHERHLLWRASESPIKDKIVVAGTLAHELAHTWFGLRVTASHEKDVWLEESFADWMMYKAVDAVEKWNYLDQQIFDTKAAFEVDSDSALATDETPGTHPVVLEESSRVSMSKDIFYNKVSFLLYVL